MSSQNNPVATPDLTQSYYEGSEASLIPAAFLRKATKAVFASIHAVAEEHNRQSTRPVTPVLSQAA
jgi:hypothetical protein